MSTALLYGIAGALVLLVLIVVSAVRIVADPAELHAA
ncbi:MAG: hypothetical protein AVDCRST_MAG50-704 [uncultured Acidimicrobiales bacterium]|uniref:Uncharacterized protein n=1 Tax=uncultured Acidimicrobiales bacterium TaxID=310071 RepID=A0A6J4HH96_9ACTN|nr:MAG: hypothetical protein AVDCRST_MAG50-704 [uncultured Acidimicrobiales bacterium]